MIFAGIELKLENVGPTSLSFNLCQSLPTTGKDNREQLQQPKYSLK